MLYIFEMANNHMGSVDHAKNIVDEFSSLAKERKLTAGVKLQFRNLDTFIHPDFQQRNDLKYVKRFNETRLSKEQFKEIIDYIKASGLLAITTPFDNESIPMTSELNLDVLKVASCSVDDWPLLEEISKSMLPIIASTGGLDIENIDDIVSFFAHRGNELALMHCVSIYPIPTKDFHLNHIDTLKDRYQNHTIGWSTHENQDEVAPVQIAMAKGAKMFERHVGYETNDIKLNLYLL